MSVNVKSVETELQQWRWCMLSGNAVHISGMIESLSMCAESRCMLFVISIKGGEECAYPVRHPKPIET